MVVSPDCAGVATEDCVVPVRNDVIHYVIITAIAGMYVGIGSKRECYLPPIANIIAHKLLFREGALSTSYVPVFAFGLLYRPAVIPGCARRAPAVALATVHTAAISACLTPVRHVWQDGTVIPIRRRRRVAEIVVTALVVSTILYTQLIGVRTSVTN